MKNLQIQEAQNSKHNTKADHNQNCLKPVIKRKILKHILCIYIHVHTHKMKITAETLLKIMQEDI